MIPSLLAEYMNTTANTPIGPSGQSQDLALDYLQWLSGADTFTLPPQFTALDWADPQPAQVIGTVATFHPALPDRDRPARHRDVPAPQVGDIVLFGTGESGFLGLFLDVGISGDWYVYSQDPAYNPQVIPVSLIACQPVGWWRPRRERLSAARLRKHQTNNDLLTTH